MGVELDIENRVVEWANKHGFLTPKIKFAERGWPDRLFISPYGHTFFIEFKRPGTNPEKDEPLQVHRILQLHERGIPAVFCDNYFAGIRMLQICLEPENLPRESRPSPIKSGISSTLSRSGSGKDEHSVGSIEDSKGQEFSSEDPHSGSPETGLQGVAGRNKEVDGLPKPDVSDTSRAGEGVETEPGSGHLPDKS